MGPSEWALEIADKLLKGYLIASELRIELAYALDDARRYGQREAYSGPGPKEEP